MLVGTEGLKEVGTDLREESFHVDSYMWLAQKLVLQKALHILVPTGST
jgi:hypothetical protein